MKKISKNFSKPLDICSYICYNIISLFAPHVKRGFDIITADGNKKMGRPYQDGKPKNHVARLRLSDSEKQKLDACCKLSGLNISEVLKQGIDMVYEKYSH